MVQPGDGPQQGRFSGAVGPDEGVDLAGEDRQRDAGKRAQLPVVHDEVADLEERCAFTGTDTHRGSPSSSTASIVEASTTSVPMYTSRTRGVDSTSAGVPSPMNSPPYRQVIRSTSDVSARTTC